MYGLSFGCIYLCREDGVWIIPFFIVAYVIVIILMIVEKQENILKKAVSMILPFVLSLAVISGYCYMNYTYYGRFIVSDFPAKRFDNEAMLNIILLGLLGMALLRCAMIAFVEVASFNIGTYVMYISTVHPLVILYSFIGFNKTFEF